MLYIRHKQQQEESTMAQYKFIYKKDGYKAGKEIRLEKITTAERIGNAALKSLYFFIAALFLFNLIRFIF